MANLYYNGIVLPECPTTYLESHPYFAIVKNRAASNDDKLEYILICSKQPLYLNTTDYLLVASESTEWIGYSLLDGVWTELTVETNTVNCPIGVTNNDLIWTNTDIPSGSATASSYYMYASEPSTGLWYGTSWLPCLPLVDSTTYPYVSIAQEISTEGYGLVFTSSPYTFDSATQAFVVDESTSTLYYVLTDSTWVLQGTTTVASLPISSYNYIWSDYDIIADDESVYKKYIEPSIRIMYGNAFLPKIPDIDESVYPYTLVDTFNVYGFYYPIEASAVAFSNQPLTYNGSKIMVPANTTCTAFVFTEGIWNSALENTLVSTETDLMTLLESGIDGYETKETAWGNYDVVNTTDNSVYCTASEVSVPSGIAVDLGALKHKPAAYDEETGQIGMYKIGDIVTHEQILQGSQKILIDDMMEIASYFKQEMGEDAIVDISSTFPMMILYQFLFVVCPYDNYTYEGIVFPEKGLYSSNKENMDSRSVYAIIETPEVEPIYEGSITTVADTDTSSEYYGNNYTTIIVDRALEKNMALLVTIDGVDYVSAICLSNDILYFGDGNPYQAKIESVDTEANTSIITFATAEAGTYDVKIMVYTLKSANRTARSATVSIASSTIGIGESAQITITDDNAAEENPVYTYEAGSTYYATVYDSGVVTGKRAGSTTVYVKSPATESYQALSQSISVTIQSAEANTKTNRTIEASIGVNVVNAGETAQVSVTSDNASSESPTYTYLSNDTSVATIDENGVITGIDTGTAIITVTGAETTNYEVGAVTIKVKVLGDEKLDRVIHPYFQYSTNTMPVGATNIAYMYSSEYYDNAYDDSPTYTYTSSNEDVFTVATIAAYGQITATGLGEATLTVYSPETTIYKEGTYTITIKVISYGIIPNEYTFDFSNGYWNLLYPDNYSVSNTTYHFEPTSSWTYNGKSVLRTEYPYNSRTYTTTITFTLQQEGKINFYYRVSSESGGDYLTIFIDGTQVVNVSGEVDWTEYVQDGLAIGDHTLKLQYAKNSSGSSGTDRAAIGGLTIKGFAPPFSRVFLIRSEGTLYTTTDDTNLVAVEGTELSSSLFTEYGFIQPPTYSLISNLVDPEILYYSEIEEELFVNVALTATPPAQTIITNSIKLVGETISGIENVTVSCTGSPLFACSFDNGVTWKLHDGSAWVDATDEIVGMTSDVLVAITTEQWAEMTSGVESFKFRFVLDSLDDTVQNIIVNYINTTTE